MSGHSKWATIKRQKGANDAKRGQLFTKLANSITIAVRQSGSPDPDMNPRLRLAIDTARNANMPKDNIDRAIQRASGKDAKDMEEVLYEGFGPNGVSVIVEAVTDNKMRTTPEIKSLFEKNGGTIGNSGSVTYQFKKNGLITVVKNNQSFDDIFLLVADAGPEDLEESGEDVLIYTKPGDLAKVRDAIATLGLSIISAELVWKPLVSVVVEDSTSAERILAFMEKLEGNDDVQKVYANFDIPDLLLSSLS